MPFRTRCPGIGGVLHAEIGLSGVAVFPSGQNIRELRDCYMPRLVSVAWLLFSCDKSSGNWGTAAEICLRDVVDLLLGQLVVELWNCCMPRLASREIQPPNSNSLAANKKASSDVYSSPRMAAFAMLMP